MLLNELTTYLKDRLNKKPLNPRHILSQFKLNNEDYRHSYEYTDPRYYPFFYYLGKKIKPSNLLEFGLEMGIESGCFIHGCKTLNGYLGFKSLLQNYWSPRLALCNIKNVLNKKIDYWYGDTEDPEFIKAFLSKKWDCVLMLKSNLTNRYYLDLAWNQMPIGGYLIVDNIKSIEINNCFKDFCIIKNREGNFLDTRYGTGIIIK